MWYTDWNNLSKKIFQNISNNQNNTDDMPVLHNSLSSKYLIQNIHLTTKYPFVLLGAETMILIKQCLKWVNIFANISQMNINRCLMCKLQCIQEYSNNREAYKPLYLNKGFSEYGP